MGKARRPGGVGADMLGSIVARVIGISQDFSKGVMECNNIPQAGTEECILCGRIIDLWKHPWGYQACQYLIGYHGDGDCLEEHRQDLTLTKYIIWGVTLTI